MAPDGYRQPTALPSCHFQAATDLKLQSVWVPTLGKPTHMVQDALQDVEDCSHRFLTQFWASPCWRWKCKADHPCHRAGRPDTQAELRQGRGRTTKSLPGFFPGTGLSHLPWGRRTLSERAQRLKITAPSMLTTMDLGVQGLYHCPLSVLFLGSYTASSAPAGTKPLLPCQHPPLPQQLTSALLHSIQLPPLSSAGSHPSRFTPGSQLAACAPDSDTCPAAQAAAGPKEADRGSHSCTAQHTSEPPCSLLAGSDQTRLVALLSFRGTENLVHAGSCSTQAENPSPQPRGNTVYIALLLLQKQRSLQPGARAGTLHY